MADRIELTIDELRRRPLPDHGDETSKHERGTVLVIGGTEETPGAVVLAGVAALRAGAGKLQVATAPACASAVAVALPEARVIAIDADLDHELASADAVLVGPGALDPERAAARARAVIEGVDDAVVVIDTHALAVLGDDASLLRRTGARAVLTPNPGELSHLPGEDALSIADATGAVVAVRGGTTEVAQPGGPVFVDRSGNPGLGTSGSGDVLVGMLAGFAARGADPLTATLWATAVHGRAGERCAARIGPLGYLARELLDEIPGAVTALV